MKDVKKLLRQERKSILPDEKIKQNIKDNLNAGVNYQNVGGHTMAVKRTNKKVSFMFVAIAVVLIMAFALVGTMLLRKSPAGIDDFGLGKFNQITNSESFYCYGAASIGTVISSSTTPATVTNVSAKTQNIDATHPTDEQMQSINKYMSLAESLLAEGDINHEHLTPIEGYEDGMLISYQDFLGNVVSYEMYINKTPYDKVGDDEQEFSIDGILIVDGVNYPVQGRFNEDAEQGETETELYFRAYLSETDYIEVTRKAENEVEGGQTENELEYIYTLYSQGNVKERTLVKYEQEGTELDLVITIEANGDQETLVFQTDDDSAQKYMKVSGKINGQDVAFSVYVQDGKYHYVFDDGTSVDLDRNQCDDDDDDDDDNDVDDNDDDDDDGNDDNDDDRALTQTI